MSTHASPHPLGAIKRWLLTLLCTLTATASDAADLEGLGLSGPYIYGTANDTLIFDRNNSPIQPKAGIAACGYFTLTDTEVATLAASFSSSDGSDHTATQSLIAAFVSLASDDFYSGFTSIIGLAIPGCYYCNTNYNAPGASPNRSLYTFFGNASTLASSVSVGLVKHDGTTPQTGGQLFLDTGNTLLIGTSTTTTYDASWLGGPANAPAKAIRLLGRDTPMSTSAAASGITAAAATLNGTVNPNGLASTVCFEYGLTTAYGSSVAATPSLLTGDASTAVSAILGGLPPGTTYHYRVSATNTAGTSNGADMTFATLSTNANLSDLALGSGTLAPAFSSATTEYTASVGSDSITIMPTLADATAMVRINGSVVASGSFSTPIPLLPGANVINTMVTAGDGITTRTYHVTVARVNADLASLTISAGTLSPSFDSATSAYTASVSNTTTSITATPTVVDAAATVKINGSIVASGHESAPIQLAVGANIISIAVSTRDGIATNTYTVALTRVSTDASLAACWPSAGTLSPAFESTTTSYVMAVPFAVTSLRLAPVLADASATVRIRGSLTSSGCFSDAIQLAPGSNIIDAVVTAQDETTTETYHVTVTRLSADAVNPSSVVAWGAGTTNPNVEPEYGQSVIPAELNGVTSAISGGLYHSVAVKNDGSLVAWGYNNYNQTSVPAGMATVSAVATLPANPAGTVKTVAITVSTALANSITAGMVVSGAAGTVGSGASVVSKATTSGMTTLTLSVPNAVNAAETTATITISPALPVIAVATGAFHTLALKGNGSVLAWGAGTSATASAGTVNLTQSAVPPGLTTLSLNATVPANPTGLINTVTLATANSGIVPGMSVTGPGFTVGIAAKVLGIAGTTVTLSVPNVNTALTPATLTFSSGVVAIAAGYYHSVALKADGSVVAWGDNTEGQTRVPAGGLGGVVAIAAGNAHTVALKGDGTVLAWGRNVEGQATLPTGLSGVTAIAAGGDTTYALKADGTVQAWGDNFNGQTDVPSSLDGVTAIAAGGDHAMALMRDGTVMAWGRIWNGSVFVNGIVPAGLGGVTAIAAGAFHSMALAVPQPLIITTQPVGMTANQGGGASFTVIAAGAAPLSYQWRKNGTNLDNTGNILGAAAATLILANVQAADVSNYSVVVTDANGSVTSSAATLAVNAAIPNAVVAWGTGTTNTNIDPEYGQSIIPTGLSGMTTAITAGVYHSVALKTDGTVVAWGNNTYGQTTLPSGLSGVTAIAAGGLHTLALKRDGSVVAWGAGKTTLAGTVNVGQSVIPAGLTTLTLNTTVPANATGLLNTITLATANTNIVPGMSVTGPGFTIGIGAKVLSVSGTTLTLSVPNVNTVMTPAALTFHSGVVAIAAGYYHSLALKSDGAVVAWGDNTEGQTSVPDVRVVAIAAGFDHTVALQSDGTVLAWGRKVEGQTTVPTGLSGVTAIAAGGDATYALMANTTVQAWGDNANGQTDVPNGLSGVTAIVAAGDHASALKSDGTVVTWGKIWNGSAYVSDTVPAGLSGVTAIAAGVFHSLAIVAGPPIIISTQPASRTNIIGTTASFSVTASGTAPLSYQWRKNNTNLTDGTGISGVTTATLTLANVQLSSASNYSVLVTDAYGGVTSQTAVLTVIANPLPDAVDSPDLVWTTGGDAPWFAQSTNTHDGMDAARSGAISGSQESWLQTTLIGPGTLGFWWKASSEETWDFLEFYVDGVLQSGRLSGETEWQERSLTLAAGLHTVKWRYVKDAWDNSGQDAGWVDSVVFVPYTSYPKIVAQPVNRTNVAGSTATFSVEATCSNPLSYQWFKNGIDLTDGGNISGAYTSTLSLANVQAADAGSYSVVVIGSGYVFSTEAILALAPPLVTTTAASAITATSANLLGTVNPNGLPSTARFEYGPTSAYGSKLRVTLAPDNGSAAQNMSVSLSGLQPGTTYHFRLTATSDGGTTLGDDMTFATPPAVPPIAPAELLPPKLTLTGTNLDFTIESTVPGRIYQLQQSDTLAPDTWQNLGPPRTGDGNPLVITTPCESSVPRRFYRIALRNQAP